MRCIRYRENSALLHLYLIPLYAMPVLMAAGPSLKLAVICCMLVSGVMYLSTFWTVKSLLIQCFRRDRNGTHILYQNSLCRIRAEECGESVFQTFYHERSKYLLEDNLAKKIAPKLDLPLSSLKKDAVQNNYELFPSNSVEIPTPSFWRLFKEQCVTPLFSFQIFSSLLMAFDDYVLQSIFSTLTVIFVEAVLVFSRVFTISQFRTLNNKVCELVRLERMHEEVPLEERDGMVISSVDVRPSDVVRIASPIEIPCDLVLLRGTCAVNEAMLSGESVPLPKEAIPDTNEMFDLKKHRRYVLFAGTKIEKMDSTLYARVIRTSFDTEQGILLNKMLSSEDIKYDPEALRFILVLSGLSLMSSIFTFFYSKKAGYPLFIDIIVLFTNSIPFELPMEMGIAVQRAVKQLSMIGIHCLEPFRITLAGKIDVCCFDKTGTLTDSKLVLKRVVSGNEVTNRILCSCHGLISVDGVQRGDPLDCAIFEYLAGRDELKENASVLKQFAFASELKRQCVVAEFGKDRMFAMKGAPEVVIKYLRHIPDNYNDYLKFAASGNRVIALAYRPLPANAPVRDVQGYYEKDLVFAGFLLFGCKLKEHAIEMCRTLQESNHQILMITGDNLLTAMSVAEQLGLEQVGAEGPDIDGLLEANGGDRFFKTRIFARAEPRHKELIIKKYKSVGYHTMMVGDGTNDVGALKAADVGVAMLETPVVAACDRKPASRRPASFREAMAGMSEGPAVKPGDASIAAPFTVKSNSLRSIIEIIQQGRSSLVTTIQMYKILALNSITNAFFMSFADIVGIKFSEYQMFAVGLLSAIAFQAISNGKPLSYISKQRPLTTIFSRYILFSITGQSIMHILTFVVIYRLFPLPAVETKFKPSIMNTILFIVTCTQTISVFTCNYIGRPFRENISENTLMLLSLTGLSAFVVNTIMGINREFNDLLEVVDVREYSSLILLLVGGNSVMSYLVEVACFRLFMLG